MMFLAAQFGEDIHGRLLRNSASTFEEPLVSETRVSALAELFGHRGSTAPVGPCTLS